MNQATFPIGTEVIYSLHGRCRVEAIETREINGESIEFYKLEVVKPPLSRSTKKEAAIWLPINAAKKRGLRRPVAQEDIADINAILESREYYFPIEENWKKIYPSLEKTVQEEGFLGMAKVAGYLYVLSNRQTVPSREVTKYNDSIRNVLVREIAEITQESLKSIEEQMDSRMKNKLSPDS